MERFTFTTFDDPEFHRRFSACERARYPYFFCGNADLDGPGTGFNWFVVQAHATDEHLAKIASQFEWLGVTHAHALKAREAARKLAGEVPADTNRRSVEACQTSARCGRIE
jgi:hypothetical protein